MDKQQIPSEDVANNKEQHYLTRDEMDTLGEMGNISIGTSATTLYSLLGNKVVITTPKVCITTVSKLSELYPLPFVSIEIEYTRGLDGSNLMIIKEEDAKVIADMMLGGDGRGDDLELDELRLSAVGEAMNQMMGSSSTSLSTMLKKDINISPPKLNKVNLANGRKIGSFTDGEEIVKVSFEMQIGDFLKSEIMQLMPISFAKAIVEELHLTMQYDNEELAASEDNYVGESLPEDSLPEVDTPTVNYYGQLEDLRPRVTRLKEEGRSQMTESTKKVEVSPVKYEHFEQEPTQINSASLDMIMDVPLEVTVELGRTAKTIKDILDFGPGSIVELDKMAGEPVDILVNGKFVAKGEVVVIDENFGVRITDILSSLGKINSLQ